MMTVACTVKSSPLLQLSGVSEEAVRALGRWEVTSLVDLATMATGRLKRVCDDVGIQYGRLRDELLKMGLLKVVGLKVVEEGEGGKPVPREGADGPFVVEADRDYVLQVTLGRAMEGQQQGGGGGGGRAKGRGGKDGGGAWWVTLGVERDDELLALKRSMGLGGGKQGTSTVSLVFPSPEAAGPSAMTLFVVSDCLRGADVRVEVPLMVLEGEEGEEEAEGGGGEEQG